MWEKTKEAVTRLLLKIGILEETPALTRYLKERYRTSFRMWFGDVVRSLILGKEKQEDPDIAQIPYYRSYLQSKVRPLTYHCVDCECERPITLHLRCVQCGSGSVFPIHKPENPKPYNLLQINQNAEKILEVAEEWEEAFDARLELHRQATG